MIIVKVIGGLGNQMFQYAFYRNLKERYGNVKLDLSSYNLYKLHNGYELDKIFAVQQEIASQEEVEELGDAKKDILSKVRRKLIGKRKSYYLQKNYEFIPEVLENDEIYFDGFWQSEKFFRGVEDRLLKEFIFVEELDEKNRKISEVIKATDSVSIHVRRGDYITNPDANKLHGGICTKEYYNRAIEIIKEKINVPYFFIFSDDIEWAKEEFKMEKAEFIHWNKGENSYRDMQLMSLCRNNIIANSSFSWWGAWLNRNENKVVIAPDKWFNDTTMNTKDVIPESWLKIK